MTYEYECVNCHHIQEHECRAADKPKFIICERCESQANSIISATHFVLKGESWSRDNYEKSNP